MEYEILKWILETARLKQKFIVHETKISSAWNLLMLIYLNLYHKILKWAETEFVQ